LLKSLFTLNYKGFDLQKNPNREVGGEASLFLMERSDFLAGFDFSY